MSLKISRLATISVVGVAVVLSVWLFREPLRRLIREETTLANEAPAPEAVEEMIEQASDPQAALLAAWNSGKIVHREVAIRSLAKIIPARQSLPPEFSSMLLSAALDPDMNVRESALSILQQRRHPALYALAAAQLKDPDQQVRLLGLNYLRDAPPDLGVPTVAALLHDSGIAVLGMSVKLLENWTGQKFGVKMADTVQVQNKTTGLEEFQEEGVAGTKAAAIRAMIWWTNSQAGFPRVELPIPPEALTGRKAVSAPDFNLPTPGGKRTRLSDFRGKVVLVNFWTTWCTACVSEIPELIALQRRRAENLVILGVSLDFTSDEHGRIGGIAAVEDRAHSQGEHHNHETRAAALKRVREKVARIAKARGINYPILLDEKNEVGGRYNGGELPTTVIVDAQGNVRRRFVGARNLQVFEAMIAEARQATR